MEKLLREQTLYLYFKQTNSKVLPFHTQYEKQTWTLATHAEDSRLLQQKIPDFCSKRFLSPMQLARVEQAEAGSGEGGDDGDAVQGSCSQTAPRWNFQKLFRCFTVCSLLTVGFAALRLAVTCTSQTVDRFMVT